MDKEKEGQTEIINRHVCPYTALANLAAFADLKAADPESGAKIETGLMLMRVFVNGLDNLLEMEGAGELVLQMASTLEDIANCGGPDAMMASIEAEQRKGDPSSHGSLH